jgi:hypothetical protein
MPESGTSKYAYSYCQFIDPQQAHDGDRCDCFDTRSQKTKARAIKKLAILRARKRTDKTPTSPSTESAVTSDPAVTAGEEWGVCDAGMELLAPLVMEHKQHIEAACASSAWPKWHAVA